ncbi:hypothetical protein [Paraburkholderia saeva]|jgi:hypothetical protein|uniref:Uncharacterized protein n=1 Tax=Paraburkholderia saeva TaxID=2777537 RepID=A0A9N8X3M3_9BURK|nr:hypothetical protein [Paraburkholderia saeva]CAG4891549.1 hypothetical protein R52603_01220 [Paraburkholderia saeva]CAG4895724.1 hypothetical protein R70241_02055 [Paraburkholderia saeva]CAG4903234.1 hypothetical protein LMG31841_03207 [Paraburkholderia saeva]
MKRIEWVEAARVAAALFLAVISGFATAQQPASKDGAASMVVPPSAASGNAHTDNPDNPDNMPVKRPDKPARDKIVREPPASATNAK